MNRKDLRELAERAAKERIEITSIMRSARETELRIREIWREAEIEILRKRMRAS